MKIVCTVSFLILAHSLVGQTNDKRGNFLVFIGATVNASASANKNSGDNIQGLKPAFSPGAEFGLRYSNAIVRDWPWFGLNLGVGTNISVIRNRFVVDNFVKIPGYETAQYIIAFLEGGLSCQANVSKKRLQVYAGFRLNHMATTVVEYSNVSHIPGSEYTYYSETIVNPENQLYYAFVLRPEIIMSTKNGRRKFTLGIQGLVGNGGIESRLIEGSYNFDSASISSSGQLYGAICSLSIVAQVYL